MEAVRREIIRGGGRRLLNDCTVVGSVGVGGSIALLLLIGFAIGAGSSWLFFWFRERRRMRIELEYRNRFGDAVRSGVPDVSAMVKAAHTPTIARSAVGGALTAGTEAPGELEAGATRQLLSKASSALGPGLQDGPLAMGAVSSFKQDPLRAAASHKEQQHPNHHTNPLASAAPAAPAMARSSSGNPFTAEVPSFRVRTNDACSLNNTPASSMNGLPLSARGGSPLAQPGLIGTAVFMPAADPSSPRITNAAAAVTSADVAPAAAAASAFAWRSAGGDVQQPQQPTHARNATVVVKGDAGGPGMAGPSPSALAPAVQARVGGSSDYLAALDSTATNPFETPALRRQQEEESGAAAMAAHAGPTVAAPAAGAAPEAAAGPEAAAAKAAQKQELLGQVQGEQFEDDELDPEWAQLLGELDARLQAAGRQRLSAHERAVAIRSLIVATTSQSADAALAKALHDVQAFRRVQVGRGAAA